MARGAVGARQENRGLAAGDSVEQLLSDYPRLTVEDIRAAQGFAADHLAHESVFPAE